MSEIKPVYIADVCHCTNETCPKRDKCYRAWLTKEAPKHKHPNVPYFQPHDNCNLFVEIKEMT